MNMKNNNQAIVRKITARSLTTNKKRNFFIIAAIMLTTFMIASVLSIGVSYSESIDILKDSQEQLSGENTGMSYTLGDPESFGTIAVYALIISFLMFVGYLLIYNVLYISISNDVRFFGLLKTIGTTPKQIRKIVIGQVLRLCSVAIPAGLMLAALLSAVIVPMIVIVETGAVISFSPVIYIGAALFSLATALIGANSPVKKAAGISPVEAIKYTGEHTGGKSVKGSVNGKPHRMAVRNIFRNKKRAVVVFLSLFLSLSLFVLITTIVFNMDADKYASSYTDGDFFIKEELTPYGRPGKVKFGDDLLCRIEGIPGFAEMQVNTKEIGFIKYTNAFDPYLETKLNGNGNTALLRDYYKNNFYGNICGIDKAAIIELNKSLSEPLDAVAFERGEFALIATGKPDLFDNVGNMEITCESSGKTFIIPLGGFAPAFYKWTGEHTAPAIFVSNAFLKQYVDEPLIASVDINVDEKYGVQALSALQEIVGGDRELELTSRIEERQVVENAKTILFVLGGAVSAILGMIGILNFVNVMSVGILARKRELAALESIGMTRRQTRRMLVCEGAGYAVITLLLVSVIGNALAIGICKLFEQMQRQASYSLFVFSYPFVPVLITGLAVIMICVITPELIYRSISRASIVERLRESE